MSAKRWLAEWRHSEGKPVLYHCISRIVDRRFVLGPREKEKFRTLMRMLEKFSGCRVLSYCLMDNHFHLLLEVPPMPVGGLSEDELFRRLGAIYNEGQVAAIVRELTTAAQNGSQAHREEILHRYTYRMHDLSQFMKALLHRFSVWFNRTHQRTGTLWEERYKSLIVEDGIAARTIAAYIDLNPVRAGLVTDPADYRWSSYGEAIGGGKKGNGKTARAGLVRALRAHQGTTADATLWKDNVSREYRALLLAGAQEKTRETVAPQGTVRTTTIRKGIPPEQAAALAAANDQLPAGKALRCRLRYFTDGAVLGSRAFVDAAFRTARERFGPHRKDGARKLRGEAAAWSGQLWTFRDLRTGIG